MKAITSLSMSALRMRNLASIFKFSVSAGQNKDQTTATQDSKFKYKFIYGSHMIPHPEKAYKGGQDAMFASDNVLVVADGVGGWADQGVDPGLYSKKLCQIIGKKIQKQAKQYIDNPQKLVVEAVKQNKQVGSTTVCVLSLNPDSGHLQAYYLGDSVYGFFKKDTVEMADDQQKSFNFPYQVGSIGDNPQQGVLHKHEIQNVLQKTIVIASDGVWDNYPLQNMQKDIVENTNQNDLKPLSQKIAQGSFKHSLMQNFASPFYKKALEHKLRTYKAGKPDDITVIVAKVVKQQNK